MKKTALLILGLFVLFCIALVNLNFSKLDSGMAVAVSFELKQSQATIAPDKNCFNVNANPEGAYSKPDCNTSGCPDTKCTSYVVAGKCN